MTRVVICPLERRLSAESDRFVRAVQRRFGRANVHVGIDTQKMAAASVIIGLTILPQRETEFGDEDIETTLDEEQIELLGEAIKAAETRGALIVPVDLAPVGSTMRLASPDDPETIWIRQSFLVRLDGRFVSDMRRLLREIDRQLGGRPVIRGLLWGTGLATVWCVIWSIALSVMAAIIPIRLMQDMIAPLSFVLLWPYWVLLLYAVAHATVVRRYLWSGILTLGLLLETVAQVTLHVVSINRLSVHDTSTFTIGSLLALCIGAGIVPLVMITLYGLGSRKIVYYRRLSPQATIGNNEIAALDKGLLYSVFISYRRRDTGTVCDRVYEQLCKGVRLVGILTDSIFRDTQEIMVGSEFPEVLERALASARVYVALIGPQWLTMKDENGHVRLQNESDFVRREVAYALRKKRRVIIPVLIGGATMPRASELPADLAALAEPSPTIIPMVLRDGAKFERDLRRLTRLVRRHASISTFLPGVNALVLIMVVCGVILVTSLLFDMPTILTYVSIVASCDSSQCVAFPFTPAWGFMVVSGIILQMGLLGTWMASGVQSLRYRNFRAFRWLALPLAPAIPAVLCGFDTAMASSNPMSQIGLFLFTFISVALADIAILIGLYPVVYGVVGVRLRGPSQL